MPSQALKQRVYHGMREFAIITLYLWVVFALFEIYKSVLVAQYHISVVAKSLAIINALALAKIAVIARELKLDKHLRRTGKPLIYSTLLSAAAFSALLACFKILEEAIVGRYHGKSVAQSIAEFGGSWRGTLCLIIIFFVMLIPFCAFSELGIVLGDGKLTQLFSREHRVP
jgi:hypothetical protein